MEKRAITKETIELLDRARRIETRLMRLCTAMGVDATQGKVRVVVVQMLPSVVLDVTGLDVSYGDLLAFCRRSGIKGLCAVHFQGRSLGTVLVEEESHAGN